MFWVYLLWPGSFSQKLQLKHLVRHPIHTDSPYNNIWAENKWDYQTQNRFVHSNIVQYASLEIFRLSVGAGYHSDYFRNCPRFSSTLSLLVSIPSPSFLYGSGMLGINCCRYVSIDHQDQTWGNSSLLFSIPLITPITSPASILPRPPSLYAHRITFFNSQSIMNSAGCI